MEKVIPFILYFFVYAFAGYLVEVTLCSIGKKKLVNRGYLFGPILPIYGFGMVAVILITTPVRDNIFLTFLFALLACSILEYLTSYIMEKLFGIKWWDYSKSDKFNLNGRICLRNCLAFGIGGLFVVYEVQPLVENLVSSLGSYRTTVTIVLLSLLALDTLASTYAVEKVKHSVKLKLITGDQTNEIKGLARSAIAQLLTGKNQLERRVEKIQKNFQKELDRRAKEFEKKAEELRRKQEKYNEEFKKKIKDLKK